MIKVENLSYGFPQKDLYHQITFTLEAGQHCAFIGSSGSGKSTLIDIIMDPERFMFDGDLEISEQCRIGYVSQFLEIKPDTEITVFQYIAAEFLKLQEEIEMICTKMETAEDLEELAEQYQGALDHFDAIGGNDFESNIRKQLNLANLGQHENLSVSQLSGGEFKLVQVIREMLVHPDVILMDEPDVFLDFEKLNGLKELINGHKGTMLVVTHNKFLLNHCFNKIIHLENTELQEFEGGYIEYNFALLQRKIEQQELAVADTEEIKRNEALINRLRATASYNADAAKGKALSARVKIQERLEARRVKDPFVDIREMEIDLQRENEGEESQVLQVENYTVSFEEMLLEHVCFSIGSKDKVALIGPNGSGKTTLLRDIYQNTNPSITRAEGVQVSYISQIQGEMLNQENTIEDEFLDAGFQTYDEITAYIEKYGFGAGDLKQKISSLSGGERNILQLAKISAGKADLLLLDEPTSHLDTHSQIALERAIKAYTGAILMISHDYYAIAGCMDYVLIIDDKTVRKMSMRKFRKTIYANHFDKDYLALDQKKQELEARIAVALKNTEFETAKILAEELEKIIGQY